MGGLFSGPRWLLWRCFVGARVQALPLPHGPLLRHPARGWAGAAGDGDALRDPGFRPLLASLPGYGGTIAGQVLKLEEAFAALSGLGPARPGAA